MSIVYREFDQQTLDREYNARAKIFADAWTGRGCPCRHFQVAGRNHFDIVFEMCNPASLVSKEVFAMMGV